MIDSKLARHTARAKRQKRSERTEAMLLDSSPAQTVVPAKRGRFNRLPLPKIDISGIGKWRFDPVFTGWVLIRQPAFHRTCARLIEGRES